MNNLLDPKVADQVIERLNKINADTPALWGKMNATQMMAHCSTGFYSFFGDIKMKRGLMGFLFGKMAKKSAFSDKPWSKNLPTAKEFVMTNNQNLKLDVEREKLIAQIRRFSKEASSVPSAMHAFFGKMDTQEWGVLNYKHLDHHLKQFGQ